MKHIKPKFLYSETDKIKGVLLTIKDFMLLIEKTDDGYKLLKQYKELIEENKRVYLKRSSAKT